MLDYCSYIISDRVPDVNSNPSDRAVFFCKSVKQIGAGVQIVRLQPCLICTCRWDLADQAGPFSGSNTCVQDFYRKPPAGGAKSYVNILSRCAERSAFINATPRIGAKIIAMTPFVIVAGRRDNTPAQHWTGSVKPLWNMPL